MSTYPTALRTRISSHRASVIAMCVALAATIGAVLILVLADTDSDVQPAGRAVSPTQRFDGGPNEGTRGLVSRSPVDSAVTRFDGGPQEGTRGIIVKSLPAPTFDRGPRAGERFDGGPNEGTRGAAVEYSANTRFDGGPQEGTRGEPVHYSANTRFDGGPEEGTRGR
jgi:hypothetical protein